MLSKVKHLELLPGCQDSSESESKCFVITPRAELGEHSQTGASPECPHGGWRGWYGPRTERLISVSEPLCCLSTLLLLPETDKHRVWVSPELAVGGAPCQYQGG